MEFEQMKKIWDEQKQEALYVINEEALHDSVKSKKKSASRIINVNEIGLILINIFVAIALLADVIWDSNEMIDLVGAVVMIFGTGYIFYTRKKRKKDEQHFDRTLLGELDNAIASTAATIRLGSSMLYWYFLPISIYVVAKMIYKGAGWEQWLVVCGMILIGHFIARWEINRCHKPKLRRLESMRVKLTEEIT